MSYKNQSKGGNLFSAIEHQQSIEVRKVGIFKLKDLIDWESFRSVLEDVTGYATKDWSKGGAPPFDPVFMFKVLVLQKFHGLSDAATENQIIDRLSFMSFLGIKLGDDIPDANTIWDFRELIETDGRNGAGRLFDCFHAELKSQGLLAKEGSIIDASFVDAPIQRNNKTENKKIKNGQRPEGFEPNTAKGKQKDCDARWTKKNNESHFGYKNHAKVDAKTKLIDSYSTTPASVHDSQVFEKLLDDEDKAVLADSAYLSEHNRKILLKFNAEDFLMLKSYRNKPLTTSEIRFNKKVSRIRVRVEHVFGRMKQMGADYCRRIGLDRAKQHNALSNLVYNLDRYAFLRG